MKLTYDIVKTLLATVNQHLEQAKQYAVSHSEAEHVICMQAVVLFQAAMEAYINEEIASNPLLDTVRREEDKLNTAFKTLSFRNKWMRVFEVLRLKDIAELEEYLLFYREYRIPITHPKGRFISLEQYRYMSVRKGVDAGVRAMSIVKKDLKNNCALI